MTFAQGSKNTHLTVIHFPLATTLLAFDTDRMRALFGKATLIDQQATVRCSTQPAISFLGHLIQDRTMCPRRLGEHMLEALVIGSCCNHLFHLRIPLKPATHST
jgi:23S rRNA C2498 (ribose-2'-O)-methylase RlmM